MLNASHIEKTYHRIKTYIHKTPILESSILNEQLNNTLYFKYEGFQKTGSFKFRGALNALLSYKEHYASFPKHIVTYSSGNHAAALSHAAQLFHIPITVYSPSSSSKAKIAAARSYGAEVILTNTRDEAEQLVHDRINKEPTTILIPPYDHDDILLGQGTSCYEALQEILNPDAIFATCGGGGWLSGSYLAKELLSPNSHIYGVEPKEANDAIQSRKQGSIYRLQQMPSTIADGAKTLSVGKQTFPYLCKLNDIFPATEQEIIYWTQWLNHLLKVRVEPTSAVAIAGAYHWIQENNLKDKSILILLSGGNIDAQSERIIWKQEYLDKPIEKMESQILEAVN